MDAWLEAIDAGCPADPLRGSALGRPRATAPTFRSRVDIVIVEAHVVDKSGAIAKT